MSRVAQLGASTVRGGAQAAPPPHRNEQQETTMPLSTEALTIVAACHMAERAGKTYAPAIEEWPAA